MGHGRGPGAGETLDRAPMRRRRHLCATPRTSVSDVMTRTVAAAALGATFKETVRTMQERKVSALPVLGGDGRVVGIVSEAAPPAQGGVPRRRPRSVPQLRRPAR